MKPEVYFIDLRTTFERSLFDKLGALLAAAGIERIIAPDDLVALKLHFGEDGVTATIRPTLVRRVVDWVKEKGGRPFLTDTNTLYVGTRANSVAHIETALRNGYGFLTTGAPIIIGDGLRGSTYREVEIHKRHCRQIQIAESIFYSDSVLFLSHFKGHEVTGFGGAIKNVAMGCSPKKGKLMMHSQVVPYVDRKRCTGCGACIEWCPRRAIALHSMAQIDARLCIGCCECVGVCARNAIRIVWNEESRNVQEKLVEYAYGVVKTKDKVAYVNFLMDITPLCDCYPSSDSSIVPDVGVLASHDPVAIDQASIDLINGQIGLRNSALTSSFGVGDDKFRALNPDIDWEVQLQYGEELGLGFRDYELVKI
nr:MAG: 4Fe-4S ferredoxin [Candidatus Thorarchaeota archaeon SMTZ1-83]